MPNIGDFLGSILAEVAKARLVADMEAVRLAEIYKSHPFLKNMPVPRFRLPEITIDVPMAISGVEEAPSSGGVPPVHQPPTKAEIVKMVDTSLASSGIKLKAAERDKLCDKMETAKKALWEDPRTMLNSSRIKANLSETLSASLKDVAPSAASADDFADSSRVLREVFAAGMQNLLVSKLKDSPHVTARVNTTEVREIKDNELLTRLRLTVSEESYEVVIEEDEKGARSERFVPE